MLRNPLEDVQYSRALQVKGHQFSIEYFTLDLESKSTHSTVQKKHDKNSLQKEINQLEKKDEEISTQMTSLQSELQQKMSLVLPLLEESMSALNSINKADLSEMKAFKNPPWVVLKVQQAVYILMNPKQYTSGKKLREKAEDFSEVKQYTFNDYGILSKMINYDKDKITPLMVEILESYVNDPDLTLEKMKSVSKSSACFFLWVTAMYKYGTINISLEEDRKQMETLQIQRSELATNILKLHSSKRTLHNGTIDPSRKTTQAEELKQRIITSAMKLEELTKKSTEKLEYLKTKDLAELRSMANPPTLILQVCFAALSLLGIVHEPNHVDWETIKVSLGSNKLLVKMLHFDTKVVIPDEIWKNIEPFTSDELITVDAASKQSLACGAFWSFVERVHYDVKVHATIVSRSKEMLKEIENNTSEEDMTYFTQQETPGPEDINSAINIATERQNKLDGDKNDIADQSQSTSLDILW